MPPQLLVVEDDADSLEMLALLLESYGFDVATAARTKAAQAALAHHAFDLVIADFMVDSRDPEVSWQHIDALVALAKPSPLGLLTSWPVKSDQVAKHGLAFSIPKPCTGEALLEHVGSILALPPLAPAQEATLRAYFAHLGAREFDALVDETCTETVIYNLPSTGDKVVGREAFRAYTKATFEQFPDARFEVEAIRPLPRGAIGNYTATWRDGERLKSVGGSILFVLEGDRIAEIGVRTNLAHARELPS